MKQLLVLLVTLLYAWVALALEDGDTRYLRTGKSTRHICMNLKEYGKQTLEVPKDMVGFFTSSRRSTPAKVCDVTLQVNQK